MMRTRRFQSVWLMMLVAVLATLNVGAKNVSAPHTGGQPEVDMAAAPTESRPLAQRVLHEGAKPEAQLAPTAGCATLALPNDGSISGNERAPNLRNRFGRTHYLILASELAAAGISPGTSIAGLGWSFDTAPGLSGSNNLIVYMQNTADTTNVKSSTWATAITGMTVVHNAATVIPNVTGPWTFTFSGGSPFTYTGGGLYVAFDAQYPVGTLSGSTVVLCNSTGLVNGLKGAQGASAPTTVAASSFRPETLLVPTVGSANDVAVDVVMTLGAFPLNVGSPHVVRAVVTNKGTSSQTNVAVTLNITGAESFSDSQTVPSLAACGGQAIVSFLAFTPTTLGSDTVAVSVPADDSNGNNSKSKPLDVTAATYSYKYPGSTPSGGVGLTGAVGQFAAKFSTTGATQVDQVILEFFAASATAYRVALYGDDGSGLPGAQLYADGSDRTVGVAGSTTITLPSPVSVGPGNFFVAVEQTNTTNASYSFDTESPIRAGNFFLSLALDAGPWTDFSPGNDFKLNIGVHFFACTNNSQCDDQSLCTNDACVNSVCTHTSAVNCNDSDPCTVDTCIPSTGGCDHAPDPCDDLDPCTFDTCDPQSGCAHANACAEFCGGSIVINDASGGTPYPSTISVSGVLGNAQLVKVFLGGLTHSFVADVDIMLEGPAAQNAVILSDVGGVDGVTGVDVTLADTAADPLPAAAFPSGEYQPTDITPGDVFPAPAPANSGNTALASFTNGANGTWNLWVADDANLDTGDLAEWCLDFFVTCNNAADCDDANPCTNDSCSGGLCLHTGVAASANVAGDVFQADKATYSWVAAANATSYDVVRGLISALPVGPGGGDETCLGNTASTSISDGSVPAPGAGVFYIVRGKNACTTPGTYGFGTFGERITTTCP